LIVPCYNEAARIDLARFRGAKEGAYFLFVNDGSKDNTAQVIQQGLLPHMYLLDLEKNVGKAQAVLAGFQYMKTLPQYQHVDWVGYWDADLSTPLDEMDNFIQYAEALYGGGKVDAVFGSRVLRLGSDIKRLFIRHLCGRLFATVMDSLLHIGVYDSQCGAKLFRKDCAESCFGEPFISRWIFDVEVVLRMKSRTIIEYPLKEWRDVPGGKFRLFSGGMRALLDVVRLKKKYQ